MRPSHESPFQSLTVPITRASTIVFDSLDDFVNRFTRQPDGFSYGVTGTPTTRALEKEIASLENGAHCVVFPSGQAALTAAALALLKSGDHVLVTDGAYGPFRDFCVRWLAQLGIEVGFYPANCRGAFSEYVRPNTRLIHIEAPASLTMEMPDIPAIVKAARAGGIRTMMDNTWASTVAYRPLEHGVDLSIEAASKLFGGHSDLLMGTVSTNDFELHRKLRDVQSTVGLSVSPDEAALVLRGLHTLELRYKAQAKSTLKIAEWLDEHPMVERVHYPALRSDQDFDLWQRDFTSAGCVLSFSTKHWDLGRYRRFFAKLNHFAIGASWGGVHSLAAFYPGEVHDMRAYKTTELPLIRLSIGLEDVDTLVSELQAAFG
ncbi:cystathionine beta-lyase [Paraburkholderia phenoliruptrix]|uniref:Cystathionine beta-lyase n=2 Tax=Paraburkholderia phenoliruptrix TaxID=252970 RepID=K0E3G6_9BURK|nr:cystathionine beta-lyase [Paraburkholderia phenoliruptrix]AFT90359.1 cystathionine beta-lyase [Paraburkholderia phenoliruptrix BR3459a]CAB4051780.1 Cystathionine beta-lyase MetC [Paraburkholderia phenoliruptrix]